MSLSAEIREYQISPYNKYDSSKQILPYIIRTFDRIDERLKLLEKCEIKDENVQLHGDSVDALNNLISELQVMESQKIEIDKEVDDLDVSAMEDDFDSASMVTADYETPENKKILETNPEVIIGKWKAQDISCNKCIKTRMKTYDKAKKQKIKDQKLKLKKIKKLQSKLLGREAKLIKMKMKDVQRGRQTDYGVEVDENEKLRRDIKKMVEDPSLDSKFAINLYL